VISDSAFAVGSHQENKKKTHARAQREEGIAAKERKKKNCRKKVQKAQKG
jgi:hypothetical protein